MATFNGLPFIGPVQVGVTSSVFREINKAVGVYEKVVILGGDSCLISLYAGTIGGSLSVTVSTAVEVDKEFPIITFPVLTSSTSDLILKKASITMGLAIIRVEILGGPADFDIDIRALATADGSTRILGAASATATARVVTSTASLLIPATNKDRNGLTIKNHAGGGILYVGFTPSEATTANGYPVYQGADFAADLAAGQAIYAVSSGPSLDIRLAEALG